MECEVDAVLLLAISTAADARALNAACCFNNAGSITLLKFRYTLNKNLIYMPRSKRDACYNNEINDLKLGQTSRVSIIKLTQLS